VSRRPRRKGGTLRDAERRQLALASRTGAVARPVRGERDRVLCDGGSRGNPGPAAIAAVLVTAQGEVARAERIGWASAAEAEYRALLLGLDLAAAGGVGALDVCSDSQLAIAGVRGAGPADRALAALAHEVRAAARRFDHVAWIWHPRAENGAADELVRDLLWS
jgi:ribonuclease HI